ncbi:MAG: hypothetical protein AAGA83_20525 [Cyanobacteria bacterium P01_F01_bin.116]
MPFLPLFIVIGVFLATSKILQPGEQQNLRSASEDYDEKLLSRALIDYIARESKSSNGSEYDGNVNARSGNKSSKSSKRR